MAHILAVDDEAELRALLKAALEREGHQVLCLACGAQIEQKHCRWADCILLDVMMPGEDGFATCRRIREMTDCPILFLTARAEEADILMGLGVGGDDYLIKPFRVAELRARVSAHIRRQQRTPRSRLLRGAFSLDLGERVVYCRDQPLRLTRGEYAICEHLALHAGQTFTKEQIYETVFGYDAIGEASAVVEHIRNIRAKLRLAGEESPIVTVWGVGYQWRSE